MEMPVLSIDRNDYRLKQYLLVYIVVCQTVKADYRKVNIPAPPTPTGAAHLMAKDCRDRMSFVCDVGGDAWFGIKREYSADVLLTVQVILRR